jgi:LacI family transcriptional regulator
MGRAAKPRPHRAATLADVGRAAGVSAMAASAALNGARTSSRIAPATRDRIVEAAAKLRYRANATARALARRRMNTIGIAVVIESGELNQYFLEVFNGILEGAAEKGQTATIFTLLNWEGDASRLASFCDGRIDGLILIAPLLSGEAVKSLPDHAPFVAIHANRPLPGVLNLESDEGRGACDLVRYLISQGHRRILHLSGPAGMVGAERRLRGYRRALASARIPFDPSLVAEAGFRIDEGRNATRLWLAQAGARPLPDAIFCASDGCAVGCLEALAEAGIRVPDDVSVAGFDDTLAARTTVPQLMTVRQPLRAMGRRAVAELLARLNEGRAERDAPAPPPIVFPVELAVRASVRTSPGGRAAARPER